MTKLNRAELDRRGMGHGNVLGVGCRRVPVGVGMDLAPRWGGRTAGIGLTIDPWTHRPVQQAVPYTPAMFVPPGVQHLQNLPAGASVAGVGGPGDPAWGLQIGARGIRKDDRWWIQITGFEWQELFPIYGASIRGRAASVHYENPQWPQQSLWIIAPKGAPRPTEVSLAFMDCQENRTHIVTITGIEYAPAPSRPGGLRVPGRRPPGHGRGRVATATLGMGAAPLAAFAKVATVAHGAAHGAVMAAAARGGTRGGKACVPSCNKLTERCEEGECVPDLQEPFPSVSAWGGGRGAPPGGTRPGPRWGGRVRASCPPGQVWRDGMCRTPTGYPCPPKPSAKGLCPPGSYLDRDFRNCGPSCVYPPPPEPAPGPPPAVPTPGAPAPGCTWGITIPPGMHHSGHNACPAGSTLSGWHMVGDEQRAVCCPTIAATPSQPSGAWFSGYRRRGGMGGSSESCGPGIG